MKYVKLSNGNYYEITLDPKFYPAYNMRMFRIKYENEQRFIPFEDSYEIIEKEGENK